MRKWVWVAMVTAALTTIACGGKTEEEKAAEAIEQAFGDAFSDLAKAFIGDGIPLTPREVKLAAIGDKFRLLSDDATVSFDSMSWRAEAVPLSVGESFASSRPDPGNSFLVVTFTIVNGSDGDVEPDGIASVTQLEDELGRQNPGVTLLADDRVYEQIWGVPVADIVRPGRTGRGIMFFDVDPASPGLVLRSGNLGFEIPVPRPDDSILAPTFSVPVLQDEGRVHIEPGTSGGPYTTSPAASGSHWITLPTNIVPTGSPARWGSYGQPLSDEVQIHNLEHGGIVINYDCPDSCPELIAQLESLIPSNGAQFILAPYANMDTRIAITAWRHQDRMDEFDADRLNAFIDAYLDRAPESVPGNLF